MADVLKEVDEMMRQERAQKFWDENGKYIIAFVVMTILFTAGISGYRAWDDGVRKDQTAAILIASEAENYPENISDVASNLRGDIRGIALLNGANVFLQQGRPAEALSLYQELAAAENMPNDLQALGILMSVRLSGGDMPTGEKLEALAGIDAQNLWYPYALLEQALILANEQDDAAAAVAALETLIALENVPESLIGNAGNLLHLYTIDAAS